MSSDPAARVPQRGGLARRAVAFGVMERALTSIVSFVRIPLLLWGLGVRDYGVWMAVLGVVAAANMLDFGLHYGLTNAVAHAKGADDWSEVRRSIATAFVSYAVIAGIGMAVLIWGFSLWDSATLLRISPDRPQLLHTLVTLGIITLAAPMPLKAYAAALTGNQEQWIVSIFRSALTIVQVVALAIALTVARVGIEGVAWTGLLTEVAGWCALAVWVERRRPHLGIRLNAASRECARPLLGTSLTFLTINLANLFKAALGSTIIANARGPEAVAGFSVPFSMFVAALAVAAMVSSSLWPAYGEAGSRGDWAWIEQAFVLGTKVSVGVAAAFAVLGTWFGRDVMAIWAPTAGTPTVGFLGVLGVWLIAQAVINSTATLLNGTGQLRIVTYSSIAEGGLVFVGSLYAVGKWGSAGVAYAMASAGFLNAGFLLLSGVPRGTKGHVPAPIHAVGRLVASVSVSAAMALLLSITLRNARPVLRLGVGAFATAGVLCAVLWFFLLLPDERARIYRR